MMKPMMKLGENCCLAHTTGCWDPEFEPSIEEIMDYPMIYGDSLSSLSLASLLSGGFPYSVKHVRTWQVKVNWLKSRAPILYAYTEHAQFINVY